MLGMNSKRTLVSGEFAKEIRERVYRIQTKQLNGSDRAEIRNNRSKVKKYSVTWK